MVEPTTKKYIQTTTGQQFEVREDIPPPCVGKMSWPFGDMRPGQTVFIPNKNSRQVTSALRFYRIKKKWIFHTQTLVEDGVRGVRVWRLKGKHDYD